MLSGLLLLCCGNSCAVAADDGGSNAGKAVVFAGCDFNYLPTAPTISMTNTAPIEGADDLICVMDTDSTDGNGDTVTYTFSWTIDGVDYTGTPSTTTETGDTIDASETAAGEVWECTVTPNDGTEDARKCSLTVPRMRANDELPHRRNSQKTTDGTEGART